MYPLRLLRRVVSGVLSEGDIVRRQYQCGLRGRGKMPRSFSILLLIGLFPVQAASAGLEEAIVLYLPFSEGEGVVVKDFPGKGNDGTVIGGEWTDGKSGGGMEFLAAGQYAEIPPTDSLNLSGAISITAWVKATFDSPPGSGHYGAFVVGSNTGFGEGADEGWGTESINFAYHTGGQLHTNTKHGGSWSSELNIPVSYKAGEWHHVGLVLDGGKRSRTMFFDGEEVGTDSGYTPAVDLMWFVGHGHRGGAGGTEYLDGAIDEVYILNQTLTAQEIADVRDGKLSEILLSVAAQGKLPILWGAIRSSP